MTEIDTENNITLQVDDKPSDVINAKNLFRFLAEVKKLSSPTIRDYDNYDQIIWVSDIPREKGCFTKAWELIGQPADTSADNWVEIAKPNLTAPPELPDSLDLFVVEQEWRNSVTEQPSLIEVSREQLIRHFLPDEDIEPEFESHSINDHEDVFAAYVEYVDSQWSVWAKQKSTNETDQSCPEPPEILRPWLDDEQLQDRALEEPPLKEEISVEIDTKFREAKQKLEDDWQHYLDNKWHPWAEQDRKLQKIQTIYNQLYSAYQRRQKLGEQYEVVMGFGLLSWLSPQSGRVRRHVLTTEASIEFDARNGVIAVHAAPNGSVIAVEDDMLHSEERPQPSEKSFIDQQLKEAAGEFWDQAIITSLATSFVNALQDKDSTGLKNDGKYEQDLERPATTSATPVIHLAPAIILRKRSQRGFIRLLKEIEAAIDAGGAIPDGIKVIVNHATDDPARVHGEGEQSQTTRAFTQQEVYFPLPANKEQMQIVNYLDRGKGVRVQGPPGTGKSHTITNLICHLLATGQRVLVTSETERALRSLRSKFTGAAQPLSDLAVILLGNDSTSLRELEKSVSAINSKKEHWNKSGSVTNIASFEQRLQETRERKRLAENDLRGIRESDVYTHANKFDYYSGTLQEIAQTINEQAEEYTWLKDTVSEAANAGDIIKVDPEKFVRLWHRWQLADSIEHGFTIIDTEQLPTAEQLEEAITSFNKLTRESEALKQKSDHELLATIKATPTDSVKAVYQAAEPILAGLRNLRQHVFGWAFEAGRDIVAEQDRSWRELFKISHHELQRCKKVDRDLAAIEVQGVADDQVRYIHGHVTTALSFAEQGKKVKKSIFNPGEYKAALKGLDSITIDGHPIASLEALQQLDQWLDVKDALNTLANNWSSVTTVTPGSMTIQIARYGDWLEPLEQALDLHSKVQACQQLVDELAKFAAPHWHVFEELEQFCSTFAFYYHDKRLADASTRLAKYAQQAETKDGTESDQVGPIQQAVLDHNSEAYHGALEAVTATNKLHNNKNIVVTCARQFRSLLPHTFREFAHSDDIEGWVTHLGQLQLAIQWTRASAWVTEMTDPKAAQKVNANIEIYTNQERELLGKIAEEKAWGHCIGRLGESQRQALMAWLLAIERIGKGMGKHAEAHRRTARQKLIECQSAIPAWVMPLHRVVDTVQAKPEIFDVAIIDEASQSGSEALILNYIAKKVIVVGDDKQIRPQNIGVNHDDVEYLRNSFLSDIPHSDTFDLKSSYFSQAAVRFPSQVSLKEHFRCMPEIIQFSNNHFYQSAPLIPLKQFGSNRLEPVLTEYVEDGFRKGTSSRAYNKPEAQRLVERLAECCSDLAYDGKSFGVITLLGHAQSALIEELLLNEIDPREYEERRIMVGSAYTFQGDERDVIFISMVDAPQDGRPCRAVTSAEKEREFNVAASRAMEQMVLFHSATQHDLNEQSLQHKLLSHCLNPTVEQLPVADMSLNELRETAHTTDRVLGNQPSPFDSWFEVDVFLQLANRGYQLMPQYTVNPNDNTYRIDIVVMGMNGKLAIECDGDHWHGPAEYESDMARQRELERCGWEFWRVRGGAFYRDQQAAMAPLWELLEKQGIFPEGYQAPTEELVQRHEESQEPCLSQHPAEPEVLTGNIDPATEQAPVIAVEQPANSAESPPEASATSILYPEPASGTRTGKHIVQELKPSDIQAAILSLLSDQPNHSATIKSIPSRVCKELGIITRGTPRRDLEIRITRSLGVLKRQNKIEEYKAKNNRIRLTGLI